MKNIKNLFLRLLQTSLLIIFANIFQGHTPEEGMFPLSEISKLDLQKAGLKIKTEDIYNPNGISLIDALVKVGGCTGSFVSEEGLILTNHHCSFDIVRQASTVEKNYLDSGFIARNKNEEFPAKELTCQITESYQDVSNEVLASAEGKDPSIRKFVMREKIAELKKNAEAENPDIKAEVSEMFIGKTYVLFRYKVIKDIRLVYAPPRSIGEFGGETDNWVWPRHTGDFSFLRAYVAKDGKSVSYSANNIPFKPKKFLKINPNGVKENDFLFILGYPGRTYRHFPAAYLEYHRDYQLPFVQKIFSDMISKFEELGNANPMIALQTASTVKTLANTEKNYRGKMIGMKRLSMVENKKIEELELQAFIDSNEKLKQKYSNLLKDVNDSYNPIKNYGRFGLAINFLRSFTSSINRADFLLAQTEANELEDTKREYKFNNTKRSENIIKYKKEISGENWDVEFHALFYILREAIKLPDFKNQSPFNQFSNENEIRTFLNKAHAASVVYNAEKYSSLLTATIESISVLNDPFIEFVKDLNITANKIKKELDVADSKQNIILSNYLEVKKEWKTKTFIPDANSTLRLTYGHVRGYSPVDATYYKPITTLKGVIEKGLSGNPDFKLFPKLKEAYDKKDYGKFYNPEVDDISVAILYDLDTTGGNSGSPVLDAYGNLVGLNFDRTFEATINDYAWDKSYSRSIGVDIRYILWVAQKVNGADFILKELGI